MDAWDAMPRDTLRDSSSEYRSASHARIGRMSFRMERSPVSCSVSDTMSMSASSRVAMAFRQSNMLRAMREKAQTYSRSMGGWVMSRALPLPRRASRCASARLMRPW